jgi:hypothetical protein
MLKKIQQKMDGVVLWVGELHPHHWSQDHQGALTVVVVALMGERHACLSQHLALLPV